MSNGEGSVPGCGLSATTIAGSGFWPPHLERRASKTETIAIDMNIKTTTAVSNNQGLLMYHIRNRPERGPTSFNPSATPGNETRKDWSDDLSLRNSGRSAMNPTIRAAIAIQPAAMTRSLLKTESNHLDGPSPKRGCPCSSRGR